MSTKQTLHTGLRLPTLFWSVFLPWYVVERPAEIAKLYTQYAYAYANIYSVPFLLKTLFAPWKSISDTYPSSNLEFGKIIQVFTLNCTARAVGAVIRFAAICIGISLQLLLLLFFVTYILLWIGFPIVAAYALHFAFFA